MSRDGGITRRDCLVVLGIAGPGVLLTDTDWVPNYRQRLLALADPIARRFGKYTAYRLSAAEYVGTIEYSGPTVDLGAVDYQPNPIAAAKFHPETGDIDDSSWRRVDEANPRWQWHVHAWEDGERAELFSHYEYRPDPWPIADETREDMTQRLEDHYRPNKTDSYPDDEAVYFRGKACDRIEERVQS